MSNENRLDPFLLIGMGMGLGLALGAFLMTHFTIPGLVDKVHFVQALQARGVPTVVDSRGRVWAWDEKTRTSYELSYAALERMAKEPR